MLASVSAETPPGKTRLLSSDAAAKLIVDTVGSNMIFVDQTIEEIVKQRAHRSVGAVSSDLDELAIAQRAMEPILLSEEDHLVCTIMMRCDPNPPVGEREFDAAARRMLDALSALPDGTALEVVPLFAPDNPLTPALPKKDVLRVLDELVEKKIISQPTPLTATFYSRVIKHAYERFQARWR